MKLAWDGIRSEDEDEDANLEERDYEMDSESESDSDDDEHIRLIADKKKEGLSKNAKVFFASDSIFGELTDDTLLKEIENKKLSSNVSSNGSARIFKSQDGQESEDSEDSESDESDFEIMPAEKEHEEVEDDSDSEQESIARQYSRAKSQQQRIDLATVEAMTLAHQVALGQKNKHDLIDEGINRNSFRDVDNLPEWFIDDEKRHSKIIKPITKEAAMAIKEKQKQLNARPIKKVLEAQGRKKMRALRRLEKLALDVLPNPQSNASKW